MKRLLGVDTFCITILVFLLSVLVMPVYAQTCSVLDGQITISDDLNNVSTKEDVVTATAEAKGWWDTKTNNLSLTNNTGKNVSVKFDWNVTQTTSYGSSISCTVDGVASTSGTFSKNMSTGDSIDIILDAQAGMFEVTATLTLSNFSCTEVADVYDITVEVIGGGSVSLDGIGISSGTTTSISPTTGATLSTTQSSTFIGWRDKSNSKLLGTATSCLINPTSDMTIEAVFVENSTAWFMAGGEYLYNNLNVAGLKAAELSNKTVVLMNSATLPADQYSIPSGVTLLIPYAPDSAAYINPQTDPERMVEQSSNPTLFRKLTVTSGATIDCDGHIRVDSRQSSLSTQYSGRVYGAYGQIELQSEATLNLNSGSSLRAYGYITGDGIVNATGSTIYELFQISDWRGGRNTSSLYTGLENDSFPVSQFYMQNIESDLVMDADTTLNGLVTIAAGLFDYDKDEYSNSMELIGDNGLFRMGSGTTITRTYGSNGRIQYSIDGDLTIGSIILKIKYLTTVTLDSSKYVLNLPSNMTIKVDNGEVVFPVRAKLLPGTILEVGSNATVKMTGLTVDGTVYGAELITYDYNDWTSGNYTYSGDFFAVPYAITGRMTGLTANVPGQLIVNGTLEVQDGAAIYSTNKENQNTNGNSGLSGTGTISFGNSPTTLRTTIKEVEGSSANTVTVAVVPVQALLSGLSSSSTDYTKSMAYSSIYYSAGSNYWYQYKVTTSGKGEVQVTNTNNVATGNTSGEVARVASGATVTFKTDGHTVSATDATLSGPNNGEYTLSDFTSDTILTLEHVAKAVPGIAATCTAAGKTEGSKCSVCDEIIVAQEEIPALGHTWDEGVITKEPSLKEDGIRTYTCTVCGETKEETIAKIPAVAQIGEELYASFGDALEAATSSDTIQLLSMPADDPEIDKNVTIDLNGTGYTLTYKKGWTSVDVNGDIHTIGFKVYGTSVRVGDNLDLYFYVQSNQLENGKAYVAQITKEDTIETIPSSEWESYSNGTYLRFCYNDIAAKEMTDDVTVEIFYADAEGNATTQRASYTCAESVAKYAKRTLQNEVAKNNDELITVLVDMLNYGSSCQTYFTYKDDASQLANVGIESYQDDYAGKYGKAWTAISNDVDLGYSANVTAESKLVFSFYFATSAIQATDATVTYRDHYGNYVVKTITPIVEDGQYRIKVEGLAVADGRQQITCTVKTINDKEVSITSSIESYVATIENDNSKWDVVFRDLMYFVDSAYEYFH